VSRRGNSYYGRLCRLDTSAPAPGPKLEKPAPGRCGRRPGPGDPGRNCPIRRRPARFRFSIVLDSRCHQRV